jgi:two-component system nitrogen regulation response regulator GlnG
VVLVVDDEALIRWSLSEALTEAGYTSRLASCGSEARIVLSSLEHDALVVVLDMRLPDVNDLGLVRHVRRVRPDARIILMSAHVTPEEAAEARGLCVFAVVSKPFDVTAMVDLVGQAWAAGTPARKTL